MKTRILAILLFISSINLFSQDNTSYSVELFAPGLHFLPFKANYQEARLGILYYISNSNLKVDIGNNVDLVRFNFYESKSILSLSIEFMGYVLPKSYRGNRLQIDVLDGFFGGNAAFSKSFENGKFISRFRIIHNSAHLVDGHYDRFKKQWINDDELIPFKRDFGELTIGYQFYPDFGSVRTYGTAAYSTMVRSAEIKKWSSYFGFEAAFDQVLGETFGSKTNLFLASQFNLVGTPSYQLNTKLMSGVKFGDWDGKGLVVYLSYYMGANPFSEYYSERIRKFGVGFFVDFL